MRETVRQRCARRTPRAKKKRTVRKGESQYLRVGAKSLLPKRGRKDKRKLRQSTNSPS